MIEKLFARIRALIGDAPVKSDFETMIYTTSPIFTITESNIVSITKVLKNSVEMGSGTYSFDSTTNKITLSPASGDELTSGDIIEIDYTYYSYSDAELIEFVRAAAVWVSIFGFDENDYDIEDDGANSYLIVPTPNSEVVDLLAIIASILIKPNYSEYKLPNLTVKYPRMKNKEDKIAEIISRFARGLGITDVLEFD